jgi:hypothetical protein
LFSHARATIRDSANLAIGHLRTKNRNWLPSSPYSLLGGSVLIWHVIERLFIGLLFIWDTGYGARLKSNKTKKEVKSKDRPCVLLR